MMKHEPRYSVNRTHHRASLHQGTSLLHKAVTVGTTTAEEGGEVADVVTGKTIRIAVLKTTHRQGRENSMTPAALQSPDLTNRSATVMLLRSEYPGQRRHVRKIKLSAHLEDQMVVAEVGLTSQGEGRGNVDFLSALVVLVIYQPPPSFPASWTTLSVSVIWLFPTSLITSR